ncbi:hypothetical protein EHQ92_08355 [Leptospira biflexa]|uniref:hypothetical protein n=1 Tax=Leptospira biflexa TaxID=172 RepID=UPI00109152D4|nr:hypothetical protein [Leptospira biflexa]TGM47902.1 hypothetical protein EHQ92_08355 [Leptospira biflexa]TGM49633.1 hypothetical protein EHQ88_04730 [Leptospira biflexa]
MMKITQSELWNVICLFGICFVLSCHKAEIDDPKEYQIVKNAYQSGHLTVVQAILMDRKKERELTTEETKLYFKSLFYLSEWREFFHEWDLLEAKPKELIFYYFKAILLSKDKRVVKRAEENALLELLSISPEACLLYLQWNGPKLKPNQKKIFLAQLKQFQTLIHRMDQELELR